MSRQQAKLLLKKLSEHSKVLIKPTALDSFHINGTTKFTPSPAKLVISFNTPREGAGKDSEGMIRFINQYLPEISTQKSFVEIVVRRQSGKPSLSVYYSDGNHITLETPRKNSEEIRDLVVKYLEIQSLKNLNRYYPRPVKSSLSSNRLEEWNPFNTHVIFRP